MIEPNNTSSRIRPSLFDDTTPEAEAVLIALLRLRTPAEKLRMVNQLNASMRTLTMTGLHYRYPNIDEAELKYKYAEMRLGHELAEKFQAALQRRNQSR